jgi:hypothetical protein
MSVESTELSPRSHTHASLGHQEHNQQIGPTTRNIAAITDVNTENWAHTQTRRTQVAISGTNLRDDIDLGDSLQEIITNVNTIEDKNNEISWKERSIRVYFQNVNSLWLQDSGVNILETFLQIKEVQADIFGIVETKLNCKQSEVQDILRSSQRRIWDQSKIFTCSSDELWDKHRKPGGTMIGVMSKDTTKTGMVGGRK